MMKRLAYWCIGITCIIGTVVLPLAPVLADTTPSVPTVEPSPPPSTAPDLLVTSLAASPLPDVIEVFSQADAPLNLAGWHLALTLTDNATCVDGKDVAVAFPSGWLLPKHYMTLVRDNPTAGDSTFTIDADTLAACTNPWLASLRLMRAEEAEQTITIPGVLSLPIGKVVQHKQRNNALSTTRTLSGSFTDDYNKLVNLADALFYSDPLYQPPADAAGLQISEILPNSRSCSPLDTDPTCTDYVKFFNPTASDINLADYRIRVGYKGQTSSITNTYTWGEAIDPATDELILPAHQYFTLSLRNDGVPLSLTDSGAYVWLEDAYGTTIYSPVVQYPDAGSVTKVGLSWAYDGTSWQWTTTPQPNGPNAFTALAVSISPVITSIFAPCSAGEYRNPDTNRCKSISVSSSLTPCAEGQERNPETNRCRSIVTAASSPLTPCQPGWERNPDTNRCRKSSDVQGASIAKVEDVAAPLAPRPIWVIAALIGCGALAYAVYEWRHELRLLGATLTRMVLSLPKRLRRR